MSDGQGIIYRRLLPSMFHYKTSSDGWAVSGSGFYDKKNQPSVDFAHIAHSHKDCDPNGPEWTRQEEHNCVVAFCVESLTDLKIPILNEEKNPKPSGVYEISVHPCPTESPKNPAHAEIRAFPIITGANRAKKLQDAIARVVNEHGMWVILPAEERGIPIPVPTKDMNPLAVRNAALSNIDEK